MIQFPPTCRPQHIEEGLKRADHNREKHLRSIAEKAGNESIKVDQRRSCAIRTLTSAAETYFDLQVAEVKFITQIKTRNREIGE